MPKPFNTLTAIAAPIMRGNIDTDVIIRIERLVGNSIRGTLGKWAFGALRYRIVEEATTLLPAHFCADRSGTFSNQKL